MATPEKLEKQLLDLEKQYWQALKDRDVSTALKLTDDDCIIVGAQGFQNVDKSTFADMMNSTEYVLHAFELKDDATVRMLRDDVAVLAYNVHESLTVDGKPVELDANDASTWVRRGGEWRCALHTESLKGDPFGRDRKPRRAREVRVERVITAPAERIFDAWLDPKLIQKWMLGPSKDDEIIRIDVDPRVGGKFSFKVRRNGHPLDHFGEYRKLDRPRVLSFTFDVAGLENEEPQPAPRTPSLVTIELQPTSDPKSTSVELTHQGVLEEFAERTERGWASILEEIEKSAADTLR